MKKLSILFLIILMVLSFALVSCGDSDKSGGNVDSSTCSHTNLSKTSVVKEATCTEKGIIGGTCNSCGSYATHSFPEAGHNIVDGACTVCGETE